MKVAIRDDDTSYFTTLSELQEAYDFLDANDCVSLSLVPFSVPIHRDDVFPYGKDIEYGYYDIEKNKELIEWLRNGQKNGRYDCLLHGFSHEYKQIDGKWFAEMKWKDEQRIFQEMQLGKNHLENLLDCSIKVFVAPNNSIDKKAITAIEKLRMNYSGIIGVNDRKISFKYIKNFIIRWAFRFVRKVQYPGLLDYGKHKELSAYTLDNYERLINEYTLCKRLNKPFVIYTHYWQLNTDAKVKLLLERVYEYIKKDGAEIVPLSELFEI